MREFTVKKGVIGFVVVIGCQVAGFSDKSDLIAALTEYINDPEATEKKYCYKDADYPNVQGVPQPITEPVGAMRAPFIRQTL